MNDIYENINVFIKKLQKLIHQFFVDGFFINLEKIYKKNRLFHAYQIE